MVSPNVGRSVRGIGGMFEDKDLGAIVVSGGLATLGFVGSIALSGVVLRMAGVDLDHITRGEWAAVAASIALITFVVTGTMGPTVGGAIGLGALTAMGLAIVGAAVGDPRSRNGEATPDMVDTMFRSAPGWDSKPTDRRMQQHRPKQITTGHEDHYR